MKKNNVLTKVKEGIFKAKKRDFFSKIMKKEDDSLKKHVEEKFQIYATGIKRLKDLEITLNNLDTRGFELQEGIIRKKLKEVSLIPEIEQDIRELDYEIRKAKLKKRKSLFKKKEEKLGKAEEKSKDYEKEIENLKKKIENLKKEISIKSSEIRREFEGIRHTAKKSSLTQEEEKRLSKLPEFERKLNTVKTSFNIKTEKIEKEVENLPDLQKRIQDLKTFFIDTTRILEKEVHMSKKAVKERELEAKIRELNKKVDNNQLSIHEELLIQLAEQRRIIEEQKQELMNQLVDLAANSRKVIEEEREVSLTSMFNELEKSKSKIKEEKEKTTDRVLAELEDLREKVDKDKQEVYDGLLNKIVELKDELNDVERRKELEASPPKEEVLAQKQIDNKRLMNDLEKIKEEISSSKEELNKRLVSEISKLRQEMINEHKKEEVFLFKERKPVTRFKEEDLVFPDIPQEEDSEYTWKKDYNDKMIKKEEIKVKTDIKRPKRRGKLFLEFREFKEAYENVEDFKLVVLNLEKRTKKFKIEKDKNQEDLNRLLEKIYFVEEGLDKINKKLFNIL